MDKPIVPRLNFKSNQFWLQICLAVAILAAGLEVFSLFFVRMGGHDGPVHQHWIRAFADQVSDGIWYPRWLPESFGGLGAPVFYYYPPLSYYVATFVSFVIGSTSGLTLYRAVTLIGILVSFATSYLYLRNRSATKLQACVGGLLYCAAPYKELNSLLRGAFTENFATLFIPLVLYSLDKIGSPKSAFRGVLLLTLSLSAIVFSSLPVAAITALLIPVYLAAQKALLKSGPRAALAGLFTAGLTALYLIPATAYLPFVQASRLNELQQANPLPTFPIVNVWSGENIAINSIAVLTILSVLVALMLFRSRNEDGRVAVFLVSLFLLSQLPLTFLWKLPPFTIVGYPIRFDTIGVLAVALLWVSSSKQGTHALRPFAHSAFVIAIAVMSTAFSISQLAGARIHMHQATSPEHADAPEYYPTSAEGSRDSILAKLNASFYSPMVASSRDIEPQLILQDSQATRRSFSARISVDTTIELHQFFYPLWKARSSVGEIQTSASNQGRLVLSLPRGVYDVELKLTKGHPEEMGEIVSLTTGAILVLLLVIRGLLRSRAGFIT